MTPEERDAAVRQILGDPEGGWRSAAIAAVCDEYAASQVRKATCGLTGMPVVIGPDGPRKTNPAIGKGNRTMIHYGTDDGAGSAHKGSRADCTYPGCAHECAFPVQPPDGTIFAPGRCLTCGKTWERAQAERALAEAQAAMEATAP